MSSTERIQQDKSLHGAMAGTESPWKEAVLGFASGAVLGLVSPIVGHPLDTIKTKMQVDVVHQHSTFRQTVQSVWRVDGVRGFYRGFLPPLMGSMAYRGILFSAYSGAYAACEHVPVLNQPIPFTGGLRLSVIIGAVTASFARATIESPLDFIKVRNQIGKQAMQGHEGDGGSLLKSILKNPLSNIRHLYHGYTATLLRTMGLLGSFFIMVDYSVRYIPEVVNAPLIGPFFKGGICATTAWVFAFPFETTKSVIQSDTTGKYTKMKNSTWKVLNKIFREKGLKGLYRGFGPGASRSFVANGTSMIAYAWFQDTIRKA
mmetsp:Transcript_27690/g.39108  ORF Transcript_27690/g.39108 Transcript_27690/m.39108 type:complete len:317 (-) Transcript_27690:88-1038(-)